MSLRAELFVQDTRVSADFYTRVLGFTQRQDSDTYIDVRNGSVEFGICQQNVLLDGHYFKTTGFQKSTESGGGGVEIVLELEEAELNALYQQVLDSGYPLDSPMKDQYWGLRDFRVVDPDGYYLRITNK